MMIILGNFFFRYRNSIAPILFIFLFTPAHAITDSYYILAVIGMLVALTGQAVRMATIGLVYIIRGGSKGRIFAQGLVKTGIFAHCRNPMYIGNILIMTGMFIMSNSVVAFIIVPLVIFFYQAIVLAEENFLLSKFGEEYEEYTHAVNRWIPRLKGINRSFESMTFNWRRVVLKEFNTSFIIFLGIVLVFMKNTYVVDKEMFSFCLPYSIEIFIILVVTYLTILYLKKSKKLRAN